MRYQYALAAAASPLASAQLASQAAANLTFDWTSIEPSKTLEYHDCYGTFKCARLLVPLNYYNESDTRTAAIAIQKVPAVVDTTDPSFGGSVLMNPGGPGEPCNSFVLGYGKFLRDVVDSPGADGKHFEFIGFDPRGIGESTPSGTCFTDNPLARPGLGADYKGTYRLADGDSWLTLDLARQDALSQACVKEDAKHEIMPYMDTQSVCEDMIQIADAIEEERDSSASKRGLRNHIRASNGGDKPRVNFMGFSYGTTLGNYFVSLHPDRTGKVVLDGVQDALDYSNGPGWLKDTQDMDEIVDTFLKECHEHGPDNCALARSTDTSAQQVKDRYYNGVDALQKNPLAYLDTYGNTGAIIGDDVRQAVGTMVYSPINYYKSFSKVINAAITGNPDPLVFLAQQTGVFLPPQEFCTIGNGSSAVSADGQFLFENLAAVLCLDGEPVTGKPTSYWSEYVSNQKATSQNFGAVWAALRLYCSHWPFKHQGDRYHGPFTTPAPSNSSYSSTGLRSPVLFLSNRYDPVTPLSSARKMASLHKGSQVVVQESTGHTALIAAASNCTYRAVSDYFRTGRVPSKEMTCEANCGPWDAGCLPQNPPDALLNRRHALAATDLRGRGVKSLARRRDDPTTHFERQIPVPGVPIDEAFPDDFDWSVFRMRRAPLGVERPMW